jgi:hypothetical protein
MAEMDRKTMNDHRTFGKFVPAHRRSRHHSESMASANATPNGHTGNGRVPGATGAGVRAA